MRTTALAMLAMLAASQAYGQVSYPPLATPDAIDRAVSRIMPPVCTMAPAMDTLTGTAGVASPCTPRIDAASRTVIQAKNTTTAADATWQITFDVPFTSVPIWADAHVLGQTQPYICTVLSLTETGANGRCFQVVSTTLPSATLSLLGLIVSPISPAGANLSVRVVARQ